MRRSDNFNLYNEKDFILVHSTHPDYDYCVLAQITNIHDNNNELSLTDIKILYDRGKETTTFVVSWGIDLKNDNDEFKIVHISKQRIEKYYPEYLL